MSKSTQTDAPSRASDSARLRQSEEPESRTRRVLWMALVISTGLHLGLHFGLGELKGHPPALIAPPTELLVETIVPEPEPEPEPEVSEPEVSEPETPEPEPTPRAVRPTTDAAPEPPPLDETPPPEPEVLDLPGVVLTGPGTSNFAVPQGDGRDQEGPIATSRRGGSPSGQAGGTGGGGTGSGPRVVAAANLSRRPEPPDEDAVRRCLGENYPREARNQGIEGEVVVRGRVMPDGSFERIRVRSESIEGQGFGQQCVRCLRNRRWASAPLGRDGGPVATDVSYRCRFNFR